MFRKIKERFIFLRKNKTKTIIYIITCVIFFFGFIILPACFLSNLSDGRDNTVHVRGNGMFPTIKSGDSLYARQLSFERGEIVNIKYPDSFGNSDLLLTRRIVGLPGETIKITKKGVFINGTLLEEEYISDVTVTFQEDNKFNDVTLSDGEYYVLGDNRENSYDSRDFGEINKSYFLYALTFEPNVQTVVFDTFAICTAVGCVLSFIFLSIAALFMFTNDAAPKPKERKKWYNRPQSQKETSPEQTVEKTNVVEKPYVHKKKKNRKHKKK